MKGRPGRILRNATLWKVLGVVIFCALLLIYLHGCAECWYCNDVWHDGCDWYMRFCD
jgi:hypothetical protein